MSDTVDHQRMLRQFQPLLSFTQLPLLSTMGETCYQIVSHYHFLVDSSLVLHGVLHSQVQVVCKTWEMVPSKAVGSCTDYVPFIICHETHLLCCIKPPCVKCINHCIRKIVGNVVLWHIQHLSALPLEVPFIVHKVNCVCHIYGLPVLLDHKNSTL